MKIPSISAPVVFGSLTFGCIAMANKKVIKSIVNQCAEHALSLSSKANLDTTKLALVLGAGAATYIMYNRSKKTATVAEKQLVIETANTPTKSGRPDVQASTTQSPGISPTISPSEASYQTGLLTMLSPRISPTISPASPPRLQLHVPSANTTPTNGLAVTVLSPWDKGFVDMDNPTPPNAGLPAISPSNALNTRGSPVHASSAVGSVPIYQSQKGDVVWFCRNRIEEDRIQEIRDKNTGLDNEAFINSALRQGDYITVLMGLWSELNLDKRLDWLRKHRDEFDAVILYELGVTEMEKELTEDTLIKKTIPNLLAAKFRASQDAASLADANIVEVVNEMFTIYEHAIKNLIDKNKNHAAKWHRILQEKLAKPDEISKGVLVRVATSDDKLPSPEWLLYSNRELDADKVSARMPSSPDIASRRKQYAENFLKPFENNVKSRKPSSDRNAYLTQF